MNESARGTKEMGVVGMWMAIAEYTKVGRTGVDAVELPAQIRVVGMAMEREVIVGGVEVGRTRTGSIVRSVRIGSRMWAIASKWLGDAYRNWDGDYPRVWGGKLPLSEMSSTVRLSVY